MSLNDSEDFGSGIETPGARRDPRLSIERDHQPRRIHLAAPTKIPTGWIPDVTVGFLVSAGAAGALVVAGVLAHINWDILIWAWKLVP